jgi:hypothetical protein
MKIRKIAKAVVSACMVASSAGALANGGLDFTINEQSVPGVVGNMFGMGGWVGKTNLLADEMLGSYRELFTVTGPSSFESIAFAQISSFLHNGTPIGTVPAAPPAGPYTFLNAPVGAGGDGANPFLAPFYSLYGLFEAAGNFAGGNFTGTSGTIELWLDPNRDTVAAMETAGYNASTPWTTILSGTGDDVKLAFSSDLVYGLGNTVTGFDLVFQSLALTTGAVSGDAYFVSPRPFHAGVRLDGAFEPFAAGGTTLITGALSAQFTVPEPDAIGLLGLACTAGGLLAWRRRKVA